MSINFSSSLFEATKGVFELMLDIREIEQASAESFKNDDILCVTIEVVGDYEGEIVYKFSQETSLTMVNIMSGMEFDCVDDFVTSAVSEIANIISGNVLTMLAENEIKCDILPPTFCLYGDEQEDYEFSSSFCVIASIGNTCFDIKLNKVNK